MIHITGWNYFFLKSQSRRRSLYYSSFYLFLLPKFRIKKQKVNSSGPIEYPKNFFLFINSFLNIFQNSGVFFMYHDIYVYN